MPPLLQAAPSALPLPQGAADPQLSVQLYSLRLALPMAARALGYHADTPAHELELPAGHMFCVHVRLPGMSAPWVSRPVGLAELVPERRPRGGAVGATDEDDWGPAAIIDSVLQVELYEGNELFDTLRQLLKGELAITRRAALEFELVLCSEMQMDAVNGPPHRRLASLALALSDLLASGADMLRTPLFLCYEDMPLVEVCTTIALQHAVRALQASAQCAHAAPRPPASSGASIAIGAGEAYVALRCLRALGLTSVWVEVDLRRVCGTLLRSRARPTSSPRIDFGLRELLVIYDGSLQQEWVARALVDANDCAGNSGTGGGRTVR